jgi:hypothetical protein
MSFAQQWDWAIQENVSKIAVDSTGNIFTYNDSTIKRFSSNGMLLWKKQFSGDLIIKAMVADNSGNLFFSGGFTKFSIDTNHFVSLGNNDVFFCKIDSSGTLIWNKKIAGINDENATDLYLSKNQKIYISGNVGIGATIGAQTFSEEEFFIGKYDTQGNEELLIHHQGGEAWEISADSSGNIFLLGGININDTLDFGNSIVLYGQPSSDPYGSHFISKFNSTGDIFWAKDLGNNYYQPFKHLGIDNNGNFYLTKWQRYNGFDLSKFDTSGNFIWKHNINGIYGDCSSLCIDNNDSIWLTGDIWCNPFNKLPFIWEFDPLNHLTSSTPATTLASGNNIASDYNNNLYISGTFNDTATFGTTTLFASAGNYFLAKMDRSQSIFSSADNIPEKSIYLSIFPNPSTGKFFLLVSSFFPNPEICVFDLLGKCVYNRQVKKPEDYQVDLSLQGKGIYFIQLTSAEKTFTKKIVIE